MTDRKTASTINDAELDQLYDDLDRAQAECRAWAEAESADIAAGSYAGRVAELQAVIDRVRALHSNENGICGWCKGPDDSNISWDMEYWPCATVRATLDELDAGAPEFGTSNGQWHWRCNGGQGCDGWVGVDLHSEDAAHREYARHFEQEHLAPAPTAATQATGFVPFTPPHILKVGGDPADALVVEPYRNDRGQPAWAFHCWGTDTCDGWLSLDHTSKQSAERARDRHVAEEHQ